MWVNRKNKFRISLDELEEDYYSTCYLVVNNISAKEFKSIAVLREMIFVSIKYMSSKGVDVSRFIESIKECDSLLKSHIQGLGSVPNLSGERESKHHWWFWLDKLDELTEKEKNTI